MFRPITADIAIDPERRQLRKEGKEIQLTGLEFGLLEYLATHPNRICSRDELIDKVWGSRFQYDTGTIDVHLNALRRKAGWSKSRPIETIRGTGLVFHIEEREHRYTINLQSFAAEWLQCHAVELQTHGLAADIHLTPFINEITIAPEALRQLMDAVLAALLPNALPGHLRLTSKLTVSHFILSIDINSTISELRIPINKS